MQKRLSIEKYNFTLYNDITSIIFNEESIKNKIISEINTKDFVFINSKTISERVKVSDFLKVNNFDMRLLIKFKINELISSDLSTLPIEDQIYLKIIVIINNNDDKDYIFDDVLSYLSEDRKKIIFKTIFDKNLKYYNFTSDIEEVIYSNYLIVLSKDGVAIEGSVKSVLAEEKLLKRLGFSLPVIYDLSLQLKSYGLIDKPYVDMRKLVNDLWK